MLQPFDVDGPVKAKSKHVSIIKVRPWYFIDNSFINQGRLWWLVFWIWSVALAIPSEKHTFSQHSSRASSVSDRKSLDFFAICWVKVVFWIWSLALELVELPCNARLKRIVISFELLFVFDSRQEVLGSFRVASSASLSVKPVRSFLSKIMTWFMDWARSW